MAGQSSADNPYCELERFAWELYEQDLARAERSNGQPRLMLESVPHCREREIKVRQLCSAAIGAGRGTGFSQPDVVNRVALLLDACLRVLKWELPHLYPPSQKCLAPDEYLNEQANLLGAAIAPIRQLADSFAPAIPAMAVQAPAPPTNAAPTVSDADAERRIKERLALAELMIQGPNATGIARKIGMPRTTLLGWPTFREKYNLAKRQQQQEKEQRRKRLSRGNEDADEDDA